MLRVDGPSPGVRARDASIPNGAHRSRRCTRPRPPWRAPGWPLFDRDGHAQDGRRGRPARRPRPPGPAARTMWPRGRDRLRPPPGRRRRSRQGAPDCAILCAPERCPFCLRDVWTSASHIFPRQGACSAMVRPQKGWSGLRFRWIKAKDLPRPRASDARWPSSSADSDLSTAACGVRRTRAVRPSWSICRALVQCPCRRSPER